MAYRLQAFYKPNLKGTGTALQISKTGKGLLFSLAKQNKIASSGDTAAFDWKNGTIFNFDNLELGKILTFVNTWSNPLVQKSVTEVKFFHGKSNTPKNIVIKLTEYPEKSGNWNYFLQVHEGEKNIGIALAFSDLEIIASLITNEIQRSLTNEGTNASSIYINTPTGTVTMIRDIFLPSMAIGETLKQQKKEVGMFYRIDNKYYDLNEEKTIYVVTEL